MVEWFMQSYIICCKHKDSNIFLALSNNLSQHDRKQHKDSEKQSKTGVTLSSRQLLERSFDGYFKATLLIHTCHTRARQ